MERTALCIMSQLLSAEQGIVLTTSITKFAKNCIDCSIFPRLDLGLIWSCHILLQVIQVSEELLSLH